MAGLVLSLTRGLVLSKPETSCHQKPKLVLSAWSRTAFSLLNYANIESYGFFLTQVIRRSLTSGAVA